MFRKTVGGLTASAVVAGLAAVGVVAAAPASATTPQKAPNPQLAGCGIPVTLVLDASSSIGGPPGSSEQDQVKAAANAFLEGLKDTNSSARIVQFSGTSVQISERKEIKGQGFTDLQTAIQQKYHNEQGYVYPGTNWESAFWRTAEPAPVGEDPTLSNGLVVFVTDGVPTRYGTDTSNQGQTTQFYTDQAQVYSDLLKTAPRSNRIIAVGVGLNEQNSPGSTARLQQVSGDVVVQSVAPGKTINDFDVLIPNDFSNLEDALKSVASSLCGGAITIEKLTDEGPNGTYAPAAGWNITAAVTGGAMNPADFEWIKPVNDKDEQVSDTTAPEPVNPTDPPKGTVQFQYQPEQSWNSKNPSIRITETLDADFDPRTSPFGFHCEFPGTDRTPVEGQLTVSGGNAYFDIDDVTADQRLSCQIYNKHKRTTLRLLKQVDGGGTTEAEWRMTATGPGNAPSYSEWGDNQSFREVWANVEYSLDEIAPAGEKDNYVAGDWKCDKVQPTGSKITIPAGTTDVTCTIKNSRKGELVVKKVTDPKGATQPFTFQPTGWNNNGVFELKDGEEKSSGKIAPGNYSVAESVPSGWTLADITCDAGKPSRDGDAVYVDVPAGTKVTCEFKNTKQTAWLRLQKQVKGGSAQPESWLLSADANAPFDSKDIDKVPGNNADYAEVYADVTYKLSESDGPANYTPGDVWQCVTDDTDRAETAIVKPGDEVDLEPGEYKTCTIINERNLAELKLVKQVEGKNNPNDWTLSATADAPDTDLNFSNDGGSGEFKPVYAGTQYKLAEEGPGGYSPSDWQCELAPQDVEPGQVEEIDLEGGKITLKKGQRVTCTIVNTRDLGSLTITKEFNPQTSGFTGTFDINYTCVDGATPVKNGTVSLAAGKSETISGLPTGTTCTVDEPALPANPTGWTFNQPTYSPSKTATVTTKDETATVTVVNSISQVSPVVVKKVCPIDVTLHKPQPKKIGNQILTDKIKTKKPSCVLLKPVVLCRPIASSAAGETAFCDTKVTKKGRIVVKTKGYDGVKVSVVVRTKPKPGFTDRWKPDTWRKSWKLT